MKTKLLLAVVSTFFILNSAFGQGDLTPPGAPAPTMKTLDQLDAKLEARTPISAAPFTITDSGSYYLTANLTVSSGNAISIATNGVTLDLNGFTIASTAASPAGYGILLNGGLSDITIANGHIQGGVTNNGSGVYGGSGFAGGIYYSSFTRPHNVLVSRLTVSGCLYYGIYLDNGSGSVVESCTVRTVGGNGIAASTIKGSVAVDCGGSAIYGDQVSDCRGETSGGGNGVSAATANNCYGYSAGSGYGVLAVTANNCYGQSASSYGVYASTANNCYGYSIGGFGIFADNAENCRGYSNTSVAVNATSASHCYGSSDLNRGVSAVLAISCYGQCQYGGSYGLIATSLANTCYGYSKSGTGLSAAIANSCHGETTSGTALSVTHNLNSF